MEIDIPGMEEVLILDSGTGIRNLGTQLVKNRQSVSGHIFITHPHWDHIQGFPFFKPIYNVQNHFTIHMPNQKRGSCKEILSGHLSETFFPVTLDMIAADIDYVTQDPAVRQYGSFSVEFMLTNHTIATAAYRVTIGNTVIIYCPDNEIKPLGSTEFYPGMVDFFKGADMLVHDGQYNRENYSGKAGWGHSCWEDVVDCALKAGVKHLFLTHHDPDSDDAYMSSLEQHIQGQFQTDFESIQLAKEGETICL